MLNQVKNTGAGTLRFWKTNITPVTIFPVTPPGLAHQLITDASTSLSSFCCLLPSFFKQQSFMGREQNWWEAEV